MSFAFQTIVPPAMVHQASCRKQAHAEPPSIKPIVNPPYQLSQ
jgi:hypothetical protein